MQLEVRGRARREAARRRKSEWKVIWVFEIPLAAMAAGEWLRKLYPRTRGESRMNLRQLTVYVQFG